MDWQPGAYHEELSTLAFRGAPLPVLRLVWEPWDPRWSAPFFLQQIADGGLDWPHWEAWRARCRAQLWAYIARTEC